MLAGYFKINLSLLRSHPPKSQKNNRANHEQQEQKHGDKTFFISVKLIHIDIIVS